MAGREWEPLQPDAAICVGSRSTGNFSCVMPNGISASDGDVPFRTEADKPAYEVEASIAAFG